MIYAKYLLFSVCIIGFAYLPAFSQYSGGDADGFGSGTLTQTVCPPVTSTNIFFGGDADGSASGTLTQTVCPPVTSTNIFYGGDADGSASGTLIQTACSTCINPDTGPVYHIPN